MGRNRLCRGRQAGSFHDLGRARDDVRNLCRPDREPRLQVDALPRPCRADELLLSRAPDAGGPRGGRANPHPRQAAGRRRRGLCPCRGRGLGQRAAWTEGIRTRLLSRRNRRRIADRHRLDDGGIGRRSDRNGSVRRSAAAGISQAGERAAPVLPGDADRPALRGARPPRRVGRDATPPLRREGALTRPGWGCRRWCRGSPRKPP